MNETLTIVCGIAPNPDRPGLLVTMRTLTIEDSRLKSVSPDRQEELSLPAPPDLANEARHLAAHCGIYCGQATDRQQVLCVGIANEGNVAVEIASVRVGFRSRVRERFVVAGEEHDEAGLFFDLYLPDGIDSLIPPRQARSFRLPVQHMPAVLDLVRTRPLDQMGVWVATAGGGELRIDGAKVAEAIKLNW